MLPDSMDTLILSIYWRTEDISVIVIHVASYYVGKVFYQCPAACTAKIHRRVMSMSIWCGCGGWCGWRGGHAQREVALRMYQSRQHVVPISARER